MHQQRSENTSINFNFTFSYSTYNNIYVKCELVPKSDRTLTQLISDINATINKQQRAWQAQWVSPSLTDSKVVGSIPAYSLIARGGGRKPVSLISPTAQRVAVIGHNRAIIPPLIRHTSQPASSRLNMVCI